jgi:hypothetical protein
MAIVGATNLTRINYCVTGSPSFALRPGATVHRTQRINAVAPGSICLA